MNSVIIDPVADAGPADPKPPKWQKVNPFDAIPAPAKFQTATDTFAMTLQPQQRPGNGAPLVEQIEFVQYQLDTVLEQDVLNGLIVLAGRDDRMKGGTIRYLTDICRGSLVTETI